MLRSPSTTLGRPGYLPWLPLLLGPGPNLAGVWEGGSCMWAKHGLEVQPKAPFLPEALQHGSKHEMCGHSGWDRAPWVGPQVGRQVPNHPGATWWPSTRDSVPEDWFRTLFQKVSRGRGFLHS